MVQKRQILRLQTESEFYLGKLERAAVADEKLRTRLIASEQQNASLQNECQRLRALLQKQQQQQQEEASGSGRPRRGSSAPDPRDSRLEAADRRCQNLVKDQLKRVVAALSDPADPLSMTSVDESFRHPAEASLDRLQASFASEVVEGTLEEASWRGVAEEKEGLEEDQTLIMESFDQLLGILGHGPSGSGKPQTELSAEELRVRTNGWMGRCSLQPFISSLIRNASFLSSLPADRRSLWIMYWENGRPS